MSVAWGAVAVVGVIGVAGAVLFAAGRRGHVRRESMQLAATIAGIVGVLLTGAALIFEVAQNSGEDQSSPPPGPTPGASKPAGGESSTPNHKLSPQLLLPTQAEYRRFDGLVSITAIRVDLDNTPPARIYDRNDLYLDPNPKGIRAVRPAKIAEWDEFEAPEEGDCKALVDSRKEDDARIVIDPKIGDEFCVQTQGNDMTRYAFGRVAEVQAQEYKVLIFVWQ